MGSNLRFVYLVVKITFTEKNEENQRWRVWESQEYFDMACSTWLIHFFTLHKGRVKKCIEFLNIYFFISFHRVTFVQLRIQAYFTADNVIISFAAALKSDHVLVYVVSLATSTAKKELGWMLCLTLFIVFVCLRDRHFSHTKLLFEVTTDWREVRSKFLAKSLDIFGNASCLSQLKYSWTQGRTKLISKLIQSENKAYKVRELTKCNYCVTVLTEKSIQLDKWEHLRSREGEQITIFIELIMGLVFSTACVLACYLYLTTEHRRADKNVTSASPTRKFLHLDLNFAHNFTCTHACFEIFLIAIGCMECRLLRWMFIKKFNANGPLKT